MYANLNEIKRRMKNIEHELERIESYIGKLPEGELFCAKNGKHYKWVIKKDNVNEYLPKKNMELAQRLAMKKYFSMRRQDLLAELKACRAYLRGLEGRSEKAQKILTHEGYGALMGSGIVPDRRDLVQWQNSEYEKCKNYPEKLKVKGTQGKFLRSKSEAIIDRILYNAGIPFHYEEKLELDSVVFYPDFTIKHPFTGKIFYWEHFGLMDNQEYIANACLKLRSYCENGIVPSINLIVTWETKEHPIQIDDVEELVKKYFSKEY